MEAPKELKDAHGVRKKNTRFIRSGSVFLTSGDGEAAASICGSHEAGYLPWLAVSKSVLWGKGSEFPGGDYRQSLSW